MTGPGRRTPALLAAAVILLGTLGVVLATGVVHPPGEERLADRPLPEVDGRIAALRGPEGDRCVVVVEPATGIGRDLACGLDADRLAVAGDELIATEWGGGAARVDLATGTVAPTDHDGGDERCDEADVHADDGRLEARAEGGAVVLDVPAPRDYRVAEACASPDGEDRLLVPGQLGLELLHVAAGRPTGRRAGRRPRRRPGRHLTADPRAALRFLSRGGPGWPSRA